MAKKSNPELNYLPLTFACTTIVLFLGFFVLGLATDFGRSFTTESYRRRQIDQQPADIPNLFLVNTSGNQELLKDSIINDGRFVILDFFYTSCKTICISQATIFDSLQAKIKSNNLEGQIRLVSISFDPENDSVSAIKKYSQNVKADPKVWSILTLKSVQDLHLLLDNFGIYVIKIPPLNDLDHNASLHLIDPKGKLIKISSLENADELFLIANKKIRHDSLQ